MFLAKKNIISQDFLGLCGSNFFITCPEQEKIAPVGQELILQCSFRTPGTCTWRSNKFPNGYNPRAGGPYDGGLIKGEEPLYTCNFKIPRVDMDFNGVWNCTVSPEGSPFHEVISGSVTVPSEYFKGSFANKVIPVFINLLTSLTSNLLVHYVKNTLL